MIARPTLPSHWVPQPLHQYPDASFRDVTSPNADTLYTTGIIDVGKEPWVSNPTERATTRNAREPLRWLAKPTNGRNELWSVLPDGLFALSFADGTASYFLLEIDRGTIPIARHSLGCANPDSELAI
jgi:hypothetical protein